MSHCLFVVLIQMRITMERIVTVCWNRSCYFVMAGLLLTSLIASGVFDRRSILRGVPSHNIARDKVRPGLSTDRNKDGDWLQQQQQQNMPSIAWMLSFGGSGTSYTITNLEAVTQHTTASNYAADFTHQHGLSANGPYYHVPSLPVARYVLTKTHCAAYCMDCPPSSYVISSLSDFEQSCRTGQAPLQQHTFTYDAALIGKVIHLLRDPFDNIVGRMHLAVKNKRQRDNRPDPTPTPPNLDRFSSDATGLMRWCAYLDTKYAAHEQKAAVRLSPALQTYQHVPCHAEWFRYIQWHNLAYRVYTEMLPQLPVHYLYYEGYSVAYNTTLMSLLDFLELNATRLPLEFRTGKTYANFYSPSHQVAAKAMIQDLARPAVWKLLQHYFAHVPNDTTAAAAAAAPDAATPPPQVAQDALDVLFPELVVGARAGDAPPAVQQQREVIWLMSFPNSGTSYTMTNVQHVTNITTASNYAADWPWPLVPVHDDEPQGPFLRDHPNNQAGATTVVTKTHCAGYCDDCAPAQYVLPTTRDFLDGCRRAEWTDRQQNKKVAGYYDVNIPRRAIHLVRDPFDNLIARLHLAVQRRQRETSLGWTATELAALTNDRAGYLTWCRHIDGQNAAALVRTTLIAADTKRLMAAVPCHDEWYRYTQWHNRALDVIALLQLPVHTLYYEDYTTRYNATLGGILEFVTQPPVREPLPFVPGKTYGNFFSVPEARAARDLVQHVATPASWVLLQHYFDDWFAQYDNHGKLLL